MLAETRTDQAIRRWEHGGRDAKDDQGEQAEEGRQVDDVGMSVVTHLMADDASDLGDVRTLGEHSVAQATRAEPNRPETLAV